MLPEAKSSDSNPYRNYGS